MAGVRMTRRALAVRATQILLLVAILAVWQFAVSSGRVSSFTISAPSTIATQLGNWFITGSIWPDLGATLYVLLIGYTIGVGAGVVLGMLTGLFPTMRYYLGPYMTFLNAVPRLIIVPFLISWLGFGYAPRVIVTAFVVVFLVAITVAQGVNEIQGDLILNARVLGSNWLQLFRTVYLPGAGLWVLTSSRVSVGLAIQCVLVSELFGSAHGLGAIINSGSQTFETGRVYAAVILAMAIALLVDYALSLIERRVTAWVPR